MSSIKGVSEKLARLFLAEIGDIKRFDNAKKLIKYAGTDPVIKESGKWYVKMSISKQGNPHLRNILYQMAVGVVSRKNPVFRNYWERKYKEFRSYKKAMIAVVNKLIKVIFAMLKTETYFNPAYHGYLFYPNLNPDS